MTAANSYCFLYLALRAVANESLKSFSPKRSQSLSFGFGNKRFQVSENLTENLNIKSKSKITLKSTAD